MYNSHDSKTTVNIDDYIDYYDFYKKHLPGAKRTGNGQISAKCPFHEDKTASFSIEEETGKWICHAGCGHGNVYDFVAQVDRISTKEAAKKLHREYLPSFSIDPPTQDSPNKKEDRLIIPEEVWNLFPPLPDEWITRLEKERGWTRDAIKKLDIRLASHAQKKTGEIYEIRNPDRIAIPIKNIKGQLINIRRYKPFGPFKETERKIYSWAKGYGSNALLIHISDPTKPIIYVEGEPDFICGVSQGLNVATMTAKPKKWSKEDLTHFLGKSVILAADADLPGQTFNEDGHGNLQGVAAEIRFVQWPESMMGPDGRLPEKHGQDLTDYIVRHGGTVEQLLSLTISELEWSQKTIKRHLKNIQEDWEHFDHKFFEPILSEDSEPTPQDFHSAAIKAKKRYSKKIGDGAVAACEAMISDYNENYRLPCIIINESQHPEILEETWAALKKYNHPEPELFRTEFDTVLEIREGVDGKSGKSVGENEIFHHLAHAAVWERGSQTGVTPAKPPKDIVRSILSRPGRLPLLKRIISAPVYAENGKLHSKQGYDAETGFYLIGPSVTPEGMELSEALQVIDDLFFDIPFDGPESKAHAIATLIECHVPGYIGKESRPHRRSISPTQGSGKSLVLEMVLMPYLGKKPESLPDWKGNDEELRKVLLSVCMDGTPTHLFFDNVKQELSSSILDASATSYEVKIRELGTNRVISAPLGAIIRLFAMNHPNADRDSMRRTITIRIDPRMEHPELRDASDFRHPDIRGWILKNRKQIIKAILVIIENWKKAGCPKPSSSLPAFGSFERWREVMGGILEAAGIPGFLGNFRKSMAEADPEAAAVRGLVEVWLELALENGKSPELRANKILDLIQDQKIEMPLRSIKENGMVRELGHLLSKHKGRIYAVDGINYEITGKSHRGANLWGIRQVKNNFKQNQLFEDCVGSSDPEIQHPTPRISNKNSCFASCVGSVGSLNKSEKKQQNENEKGGEHVKSEEKISRVVENNPQNHNNHQYIENNDKNGVGSSISRTHTSNTTNTIEIPPDDHECSGCRYADWDQDICIRFEDPISESKLYCLNTSRYYENLDAEEVNCE